jgi:hypothetical protein
MVILYLLFALVTKHLVVDFFLQNYWQAKNKGNLLHPGGYVHAALHGISTFFILAAFMIPGAMVLAIFDLVSHYTIDWTKVNTTKALKKTYTDSVFWWLLGIDQYLHMLVYLTISYYAFHVFFLNN